MQCVCLPLLCVCIILYMCLVIGIDFICVFLGKHLFHKEVDYEPFIMNAVTCNNDCFYLAEYQSSIIHEYDYNLQETSRLNVMHIGLEDQILGLWQLRKDWMLVAHGNMQNMLVTNIYLFSTQSCYLHKTIRLKMRSTETKMFHRNIVEYYC